MISKQYTVYLEASSVTLTIGPFDTDQAVEIYDSYVDFTDPKKPKRHCDFHVQKFSIPAGHESSKTVTPKTPGKHLITVFIWDDAQVAAASTPAQKADCSFDAQNTPVIITTKKKAAAAT